MPETVGLDFDHLKAGFQSLFWDWVILDKQNQTFNFKITEVRSLFYSFKARHLITHSQTRSVCFVV